jgi:hypothetical protein
MREAKPHVWRLSFQAWMGLLGLGLTLKCYRMNG